MEKLIKKLQLNNKGAAMVSVIIVAAFITILASTMLYFTSMNYQMKSTSYQSQYMSAFLAELQKIWTDRKTAAGGSYEDAIKELINSDAEIEAAIKTDVIDALYIDPSAPAVDIATIDTEGKFIIQNVKVHYSQNGYSSYIITDLCLVAPDYDVTLETSASSYTAPADPADAERKTVNMSDYVIYMNWTRY